MKYVYWMQDIYLRMYYQLIYLFSMLSILGNSVFILSLFTVMGWKVLSYIITKEVYVHFAVALGLCVRRDANWIEMKYYASNNF